VSNTRTKVQAFRRLHETGCFVIPNPWDAGSARLLESLGFQALASTSAGFAWSLGRRDNRITLEEVLSHLTALAASVDIPVSADFEGAFAIDPADVARNVARAAATGIAGLSVEDSTGDPAEPLYDFGLAVERIQAARAALDATGTGLVLTARSEGFVRNRPDIDETIRRLVAFSKAGADCLFAPGLRDEAHIRAVVGALGPKPVNLIGSGAFTLAQIADMGVRRVSVGGSLARAAWKGFLDAANEIAARGTFTELTKAVPPADMNKLFERP
jgi:2-methylisocitrate lyase-like PEP mutase family enzyme